MTRIQLCGRLSVEIDGVQLSERLRGRQVPLLLAYLVLNRTRHVGRDELIDALWPNQPPVSQDAALRTLLSRLRSSLGSSALAGRDELILTLPEPVWIDVEAAAAEVTRALDALDRGDARRAWALAQVPLNIASRGLLPGAQATWLEPPRRELRDVRQQALEVIGRAGLMMGGTQLQSAERAARTLIETEPYRESGYVLLMEALSSRGNVAEALRVFDGLRTLLRDELGTNPSAEAIAAHERLLRPLERAGEPGGPRDEDLGPSAIPLPAELRQRAQGQLIGRAHEIADLMTRWDRACGAAGGGVGRDATVPSWATQDLESGGRIVLLAGDAGIGKTTLTAELARRVHDAGAIVLAGRSPRETVVPYQPFLEALRHWALNAALADLRASTREYGSELARLIPELRRRAPDLPPPPQGEPETERYRLFEAVVGLLTELSRSAPVLLVLDDLQWADRPTLLLLRHLARATNPARLLIVGAYRSAERGDTFTSAMAELRRDRLASQLDIKGLSESDTAELVRVRAGVSPARAFAHALYEETEGNPFFVEEIIRHLIEAGVRVGQRERVGAPAVRAPRGRQAGDRVPARATRGVDGRAAARRRGDRPRYRRGAARAGRAARRGGVPGRPRGGARRGAAGRVRREARELPARELPVLARADPGDAVREHVGAAAGPDPQASGRGDRGDAGAPTRALPARARVPLHARRRSRGRRESDHVRVPRRRAGDHDARARGGGRALRARARRAGPLPARGVRAPLRAALAPRRGPRPWRRAGTRVLGVPRGGRAGRAARRRRVDGARGDRGLAPVRPAAGGGRHRADRDDRARARASARAVAGPGTVARLPVRGHLLLARARPNVGAQRRGDGDR